MVRLSDLSSRLREREGKTSGGLGFEALVVQDPLHSGHIILRLASSGASATGDGGGAVGGAAGVVGVGGGDVPSLWHAGFEMLPSGMLCTLACPRASVSLCPSHLDSVLSTVLPLALALAAIELEAEDAPFIVDVAFGELSAELREPSLGALRVTADRAHARLALAGGVYEPPRRSFSRGCMRYASRRRRRRRRRWSIRIERRWSQRWQRRRRWRQWRRRWRCQLWRQWPVAEEEGRRGPGSCSRRAPWACVCTAGRLRSVVSSNSPTSTRAAPCSRRRRRPPSSVRSRLRPAVASRRAAQSSKTQTTTQPAARAEETARGGAAEQKLHARSRPPPAVAVASPAGATRRLCAPTRSPKPASITTRVRMSKAPMPASWRSITRTSSRTHETTPPPMTLRKGWVARATWASNGSLGGEGARRRAWCRGRRR